MKKGFIFIELMIVVAIIGILAAVAIPKLAELVQMSKLESEFQFSHLDVKRAKTWCQENGKSLSDFVNEEDLRRKFKRGENLKKSGVQTSPQSTEFKFCPYCGHSLP